MQEDAGTCGILYDCCIAVTFGPVQPVTLRLLYEFQRTASYCGDSSCSDTRRLSSILASRLGTWMKCFAAGEHGKMQLTRDMRCLTMTIVNEIEGVEAYELVMELPC